MIRHWYDPLSLPEWLKRTFSFLNLAVLIVTALFVFSEFRFDWFEHLAGSYLASTNESRPEIGAVWETGKQTLSARDSLNEIITKKEETRKDVDQAASFSALVESVLPGEWVTLEKHQFKTLYLTLEKSVADRIIDPALLIWLLSGSSLDRIFCEGIPEGVRIYFIDSENRVIQRIELKKDQIRQIEDQKRAVPGKLSDIAEVQGRIYTAKDFFDALFKLPSDIIPDLMINPNALLSQDGKIVRVGIWNESRNGYIRLGFEFEETDGKKLVFINGREWAVWQLRLNLKGEGQ